MGPSFSRAAFRVGLGADPFINVYGFSGGGSGVIAIPDAALSAESHRVTTAVIKFASIFS